MFFFRRFAHTVNLTLTSHTKCFAKNLKVPEVLVPGTLGDMTVRPRHQAIIAAIRPGRLAFQNKEYFVTNGYLIVDTRDKVTDVAVSVAKCLPLTEVRAEDASSPEELAAINTLKKATPS